MKGKTKKPSDWNTIVVSTKVSDEPVTVDCEACPAPWDAASAKSFVIPPDLAVAASPIRIAPNSKSCVP